MRLSPNLILWWQITRRSWRRDSVLLLAAAAVAWLLGALILGGARTESAGRLTRAVITGLLLIWLLPIRLGGTNIFDSPRFRLLPGKARGSLLLRALIGRPLRPVLALITLVWGRVGLLRLRARGVPAGMNGLWLAGAVVATLILSQFLEDIARRYGPFLGIGATAHWRRTRRLTTAAVRWTAERSTLGPALARLLRIPILRVPAIISVLCLAGMFLAGVPALALALPLFWSGYLYNLLGPDVPMQGDERYLLAGVRLASVLHRQHAAVVVGLAAVAVLLGAMAFLTVGVRQPVVGPATRWMYVVTTLYALSCLLLFSVPGDWFSRRVRVPLSVRTLLVAREYAGSAGMGLLQLIAWCASAAAAFAIFWCWLVALRTVPLARGVVAGVGARLLAAALLAAATQSAIYFLFAWRRRAARAVA